MPREDGGLVVGATVEERGFDRSVTAGGVLELLRRAYEALPGIAELELVETAAGLRPRHARQRADRGRGRLRRARVGDRALAQRDPAGADHRRRGRGRCWPAKKPPPELGAVLTARFAATDTCTGGAMKVLVNGAAREVPDADHGRGLVREVRGHAGDGRGVAVAVDAEVVPRSEWDSVELADGQRVEVLGAIQGG